MVVKKICIDYSYPPYFDIKIFLSFCKNIPVCRRSGARVFVGVVPACHGGWRDGVRRRGDGRWELRVISWSGGGGGGEGGNGRRRGATGGGCGGRRFIWLL